MLSSNQKLSTIGKNICPLFLRVIVALPVVIVVVTMWVQGFDLLYNVFGESHLSVSVFEPGIPDAVQFVIHKHLLVPDLNANHIDLNKIKCFFKNTVD